MGLRQQYGAFNTALRSLYSDDILQLADKKKPFEFDDSLFEAAASLVYENGGFDISQLEDPAARAVINETLRVLSTAIDSGLSHEVPTTVRYALENNAFIFSGFKTFHSMREIGLSMLTDKGDIKPFNDFMTDVKKINQMYNHNYLRAEYNHAVGTSLMAARWHDFEQDGDRYDLQYRTANDGKVREEHALLHETTLPASDPFWDKYFPPNGWNCRCTVVQVRKGKYPTSDPQLAMKRGDNCTDGVKQRMFRYNPGKTMELFPPKHPYYKAPNDAKTVIEEVARYEHNKALYQKLKEDEDYINVEFDETTGGVKATHKGHNWKHDENDHIRFFGNMTKEDLEAECQMQLFRLGHSAILRDEFANKKLDKTPPSLDLDLDGKIMDIASVTTDLINYRNVFNGKNRQLHRYNHLKHVNKKADAVCLYFHDPDMFSEQKVFDGIKRFKEMKYKDKETGEDKSPHVIIKHVLCVVRGSDKLHQYDFE